MKMIRSGIKMLMKTDFSEFQQFIEDTNKWIADVLKMRKMILGHMIVYPKLTPW